MIIATAGHVDHGKTALIKALTGIDTDRLPEEKARGLTIDLGFAYQTLPDQTRLGFVDVPGHEKFLRNMLAGVGGIDLALLVVAADDGVMPQTREHFAILDLLGIDQCIVAITRIDRVDEKRIQDVRQQITTLLASAGHTDIAIYPLCAPQNQGVEALKNALISRAHALKQRPVQGHFRLAIDRVFSLNGVGLVVTGMVLSGIARVDDSLLLSATGSAVRVRAIRANNETAEYARAGQRCALNIVGRGASDTTVRRGDWLIHSALHAPTRRIDVDLRVLDSEARSLKHWTPTHLHIAAEHHAARVAVLSGGAIAPGEHGLVQLVLERDAFVVHGDRFVLRDQSAQRTIAGGRVIDPFSPKRGRARPTRLAALQAMKQTEPAEVLAALSSISETGLAPQQFSVAHNCSRPELDAMIEALALRRLTGLGQEWVFSEARWQALLTRIETCVAEFHQHRPEHPGPGLKDIQLALKPHNESDLLATATSELLSEKRLGARGNRFHLPTHRLYISAQDRQLFDRAAACLAPVSGSPPSLQQAAETLGVEQKILEAALKKALKLGEMVQIAKNRYLPTPYVARLGLAAETLATNAADGLFSAAEYCNQTQTGRNFTIDLLEHFDRIGFTQRTGNNRRIRRPAATAFAVDDS